jgi:hypothetical protein
MVPEVRRFGKWLRRKNPHATTQPVFDIERMFDPVAL